MSAPVCPHGAEISDLDGDPCGICSTEREVNRRLKEEAERQRFRPPPSWTADRATLYIVIGALNVYMGHIKDVHPGCHCVDRISRFLAVCDTFVADITGAFDAPPESQK